MRPSRRKIAGGALGLRQLEKYPKRLTSHRSINPVGYYRMEIKLMFGKRLKARPRKHLKADTGILRCLLQVFLELRQRSGFSLLSPSQFQPPEIFSACLQLPSPCSGPCLVFSKLTSPCSEGPCRMRASLLDLTILLYH